MTKQFSFATCFLLIVGLLCLGELIIWLWEPVQVKPSAQKTRTCEERGMQQATVLWPNGWHTECFTTGNRFDSQGRLDANGAYVLDRDGRPVLR